MPILNPLAHLFTVALSGERVLFRTETVAHPAKEHSTIRNISVMGCRSYLRLDPPQRMHL
ncbi:hypothetical protein [Leptolyngbya sp. FACHB-711]|uniref:hypothetical protein n=1 Tax=Leptolyngbya sp. ST-U4 TaxID=2933912 RepID=UPI0016828722|nr:hypothetical protein [Leptolyngbya sp. FACHB-711]MBD1851718.1 hypothetical protein [Cyanobacteria bacterium FACHB-502]MBD2024218.1 hypothetical protein [Leptolyngbya sp. FACHB-711]